MSENIQSALFMKLADVLGQISYVQKDGRNEYFKYNYVTEAALTNEIRGKLSAAGIFVFTSISDQTTIEVPHKNGVEYLTSVTTEHTFVDGETGATFAVQSQGQGRDGADKGVYKAITGAMKYFLYKNFMVPTGDDPERDDGPPPQQKTATKKQPTANGQSREAAGITEAQLEFVTKLLKSHVWSHKEVQDTLDKAPGWSKTGATRNIGVIQEKMAARKAAEKAVADDVASGAFDDDGDLPF